MRALVITSVEPLREGVEIWGTYWRFRLLLQALFDIAEDVEIIHLVSDEFLRDNPNVEKLARQEAEHLGLPGFAHFIGCRAPRRQTYVNHYLTGMVSIYEQPEFYWYSGAEQVAKVGMFLDRQPDIVLVHRLSAMVPVLRSGRRPARMFFDLDDVVHRARFQAALRPPVRPGKLGLLCQLPAMAIAEWRGAARSRLTFVCSDLDRARLGRLGFQRVATIPNALPVPLEPPELTSAPIVLFLGACDYPPNVRAVERLVRRIFPRVRTAIPEAQLFVAGRDSLKLAGRWGEPDGVRYLGYVEDLASLYRSIRVVCCPITTGSGTRLKLIEAAGYARPAVATRFAAEGLDFRDGVDILLRDSDDAMAAACVRFLRDDALSCALGMTARARMQQRYDPAAVRQRLARLMSDG